MIATLNKSKTALTINRQEFKIALVKIGVGIDKQIISLKKAKQSYDPTEIAHEVINEANIFEAIIEGFNEAEETNLKLADITNIDVAQEWINEFLEKYSDINDPN
jgi:cobyric acid synthase